LTSSLVTFFNVTDLGLVVTIFLCPDSRFSSVIIDLFYRLGQSTTKLANSHS